MTNPMLVDLARESLLGAVQVAAPVLGCVLLVSVVVSFLQAATQMHDPTASAVPRLAAAAVGLLIFGSWMMAMLCSLSTDLWANIPRIVQ
ncbi:MAG: flagellar biosynthetic protein FliQ [Armatimonadota bacterium]|jgi:flagellar biosynthetic protein FliQ